MANSYLQFISDEHLINCIRELHQVYVRTTQSLTLDRFYRNKVDPIKFNFDTEFNGLDLEEYIVSNEVIRQVDKTINNAIGTFHEMVLGGIDGYEMGAHSGYDIRALDNSLFADIKNKHNTMNSGAAESLYQKLERFADEYPEANCYWVQIIAIGSFEMRWFLNCGGNAYNHPRVFKISADKFYHKLTGRRNAFKELCDVLPRATRDYLEQSGISHRTRTGDNRVIEAIRRKAQRTGTNFLGQIMKDTFEGYNGF